LGHPNHALSQVAGEKNDEIVHKAQHLLLLLRQSAQQVEGA
jgi:hypothetical protein